MNKNKLQLTNEIGIFIHFPFISVFYFFNTFIFNHTFSEVTSYTFKNYSSLYMHSQC